MMKNCLQIITILTEYFTDLTSSEVLFSSNIFNLAVPPVVYVIWSNLHGGNKIKVVTYIVISASIYFSILEPTLNLL